jgi:hypothetical protein
VARQEPGRWRACLHITATMLLKRGAMQRKEVRSTAMLCTAETLAGRCVIICSLVQLDCLISIASGFHCLQACTEIS